MTKKEFEQLAKKAGYDKGEIQDLVEIHDDLEIPYEDIPLIERKID